MTRESIARETGAGYATVQLFRPVLEPDEIFSPTIWSCHFVTVRTQHQQKIDGEEPPSWIEKTVVVGILIYLGLPNPGRIGSRFLSIDYLLPMSPKKEETAEQ